jgi:hypothetical protein
MSDVKLPVKSAFRIVDGLRIATIEDTNGSEIVDLGISDARTTKIVDLIVSAVNSHAVLVGICIDAIDLCDCDGQCVFCRRRRAALAVAEPQRYENGTSPPHRWLRWPAAPR